MKIDKETRKMKKANECRKGKIKPTKKNKTDENQCKRMKIVTTKTETKKNEK
jgi:hypothetical protein